MTWMHAVLSPPNHVVKQGLHDHFLSATDLFFWAEFRLYYGTTHKNSVLTPAFFFSLSHTFGLKIIIYT